MLLQELKDYLKITWTDEDTTLDKMLARGQRVIGDLTGTMLDFTTENLAKSLLLDYCRYAYNNSLEYFEDNFRKEITRLQYTEAIKDARQEI